jgi:hypothetical protein
MTKTLQPKNRIEEEFRMEPEGSTTFGDVSWSEFAGEDPHSSATALVQKVPYVVKLRNDGDVETARIDPDIVLASAVLELKSPANLVWKSTGHTIVWQPIHERKSGAGCSQDLCTYWELNTVKTPERWFRFIQNAPKQALSLLLTEAASTISEKPEQLLFSRTIVRDLLELLIIGRPQLRYDIYTLLIPFCSADDILDVALERYADSRKEIYLLMARSSLERLGSQAWPTLLRFARSKHSETELFVGLIANCEGVPESERIDALSMLTQNPNTEVRRRILEHVHDLSEAGQKRILKLMLNDVDPEIRQEVCTLSD